MGGDQHGLSGKPYTKGAASNCLSPLQGLKNKRPVNPGLEAALLHPGLLSYALSLKESMTLQGGGEYAD